MRFLPFLSHALLRRPTGGVRAMASFTAAPANPAEAATVVENLAAVKGRIAAAAAGGAPTLIAVSKLKPLELIAAAHGAGQVDFGENYVQELVEKAASPDVPADLRWHFIGRVQSNKVRALCGVRGLAAVHTVSSAKLVTKFDACWPELREAGAGPLRCFVQVNTSGEEAKGGVAPADAPALAAKVAAAANLDLAGLMCIGKYSAAEGDAAPDFLALSAARDAVAAALGVGTETLALSMGMSHDFETALAHGASHVRVGSTIFGARPPKP